MSKFKDFKKVLTDILNDDSADDKEKTKQVEEYLDGDPSLNDDPDIQEFLQLGSNAFMRTVMLAEQRKVIFDSNAFLLEILTDPFYIYIPGKALYPRKTVEQILSEQPIENRIPDKTLH